MLKRGDKDQIIKMLKMGVRAPMDKSTYNALLALNDPEFVSMWLANVDVHGEGKFYNDEQLMFSLMKRDESGIRRCAAQHVGDLSKLSHLCLAIRLRSVEMLDLLYSLGARLDLVDGRELVKAAEETGMQEIVDWVISHGAKI